MKYILPNPFQCWCFEIISTPYWFNHNFRSEPQRVKIYKRIYTNIHNYYLLVMICQLMTVEISSSCCLVITLITWVVYSFVNWFDMTCEMWLGCSFIITLITRVAYSFVSWFSMLFKMTNIFFVATLITLMTSCSILNYCCPHNIFLVVLNIYLFKFIIWIFLEQLMF